MYSGGRPTTISKILFNKYDKDNSGSISVSEFQDLCYAMGHYLSSAEAEHAVKMIDKNGSGQVTYDEFQKWWRTDNRFAPLQLSEEELQALNRCAEYFKWFDKDNSGSLSKEEFKQTHADLTKHGLLTKSFEDSFRELDNDGSGQVTYNEYISWLIKIGSLKIKSVD